jgi:cytoskeletal protein CcmA (bactofilin family)
MARVRVGDNPDSEVIMMFWKKKATSVDIARLSSLLAQDTCVRGDVIFERGVRIDGRVEGNVLSGSDDNGLLVLSDKGTIVGCVKVYDAVINGRVEGDLEVEHFLELQANACVTGNISYRTLKLECGATVDGKLLRMEDEAAAAEGESATNSKVVSISGGN